MSKKKYIPFEDKFTVKHVDYGGNHFDKVSRIQARTDEEEMDLVLDYNCDIYSFKVNDKFTMVLATSVDNEPDTGSYNPALENGGSLLDKYEYCMSGKIFRLNKTATKAELFVSFGGLLMRLGGEAHAFQDFFLDTLIYLLIKKL